MESVSEKLYLSGNGGIFEISPDGCVLRHASMNGAGAICAGKKHLFCADAQGAIWRLNRDTLMPEAVFSGGPGICDLCLSRDERHLYALVSDADSVLMLDSRTGQPLLLNRCGCNPSQLLFFDRLLAAAGGESGMIHIYDADTLVCQREIPMPGPVCSIEWTAGALYALCLTSRLDSILAVNRKEGEKLLQLSGMPGGLLVHGRYLYAASQGWLHMFDQERMSLLDRKPVPGSASRLCMYNDKLVFYNPLSERVHTLSAGVFWHMPVKNVKSFCIGSRGFAAPALDL